MTRLLSEQEGAAELQTVIYDELQSIARQRLSDERSGHTLQATALVHEAYLRLLGSENVAWDGRRHFYAAASEAMRRILVDHARKAKSLKRGGGREQVTLFEVPGPFDERPEDLLALDEALNRLAENDPRAVKIIEHRFFGGLSNEETAQLIEVSTRTVEREWRVARAWLRRELEKGQTRLADSDDES